MLFKSFRTVSLFVQESCLIYYIFSHNIFSVKNIIQYWTTKEPPIWEIKFWQLFWVLLNLSYRFVFFTAASAFMGYHSKQMHERLRSYFISNTLPDTSRAHTHIFRVIRPKSHHSPPAGIKLFRQLNVCIIICIWTINFLSLIELDNCFKIIWLIISICCSLGLIKHLKSLLFLHD